MAIEIVDLPPKKWWIFPWVFVCRNQRVWETFRRSIFLDPPWMIDVDVFSLKPKQYVNILINQFNMDFCVGRSYVFQI